MRNPLIVSAVFAAVILPGPSFAGNGSVPFTAKVAALCEILVQKSGQMGVTPDLATLSSEITPGNRGIASVRASTAGFSITANPPKAFNTSPAGGGDSVEFSTLYTLTGATNTTDQAGTTPTKMDIGISQMEVGLVAKKTSGIYLHGDYTAEVVVLCDKG
ncbi:hypothetical protein AB2N04_10235 [Nitratireductor sp. GISD-1A_MAKvit]|uniref:hypothetical protein n=1 Tax=Nitratireductor sp. GISD-1A_MAKvit TaxID=3234198 RepID=UPI003466A3E3